MRQNSEELAAAFHESGHAVSTVLAFREAKWLPMPPPRLPVRYCEIGANGSGSTAAKDIYSPRWPIDVLVPRYRSLMEAQTCIHLAGGIAEALHRCGPRSGRELWSFAESCCAVDGDLQRAEPVLRDIFRLTGYRVYPQHYADRVMEMLLTHWRAVTALAAALVAHRHVEGEDVERIIDLEVGQFSGRSLRRSFRPTRLAFIDAKVAESDPGRTLRL